MNIGFDLDGTLIEFSTYFTKQIAFDLHIDEKDLPQQIDYEFSNFSIEFRKRVSELVIDKYFMGPNNVTIDPYTILALKKFKQQGHKIIVITARSELIIKETENIINEFFPKLIDKLFLVKDVKDKEKIMKEQNLIYWFDDNPKGCKISIGLRIKTFLIYNDYTKLYASSLFSEYKNGIDFYTIESIYEAFHFLNIIN